MAAHFVLKLTWFASLDLKDVGETSQRLSLEKLNGRGTATDYIGAGNSGHVEATLDPTATCPTSDKTDSVFSQYCLLHFEL